MKVGDVYAINGERTFDALILAIEDEWVTFAPLKGESIHLIEGGADPRSFGKRIGTKSASTAYLTQRAAQALEEEGPHQELWGELNSIALEFIEP